MDTTNPQNTHLVSSLKDKADDIDHTEVFMESIPQLVLQVYIFTQTGHLSKTATLLIL